MPAESHAKILRACANEYWKSSGGRAFDIDDLVDHIQKNAPEFVEVSTEAIKEQAEELLASMAKRSPKRPTAAKGRRNGTGPAGSSGDSSDEPIDRPTNVPASNAMNKQVMAAVAKRKELGRNSQDQQKRSSKKRKASSGGAGRSSRRVAQGEDGGGGGGGGCGGAPAAESNPFEAAERPTVRLADVGGVEQCLQMIRELIEWPLSHPEVYTHLGVAPPRGVLLHGPPGCGKTLLSHAIAGELGVPFLKISAPEIVAGTSGESESKIRSLFEQAKAVAPSILFIDEVDAITPKRENAQREMERRIVATLLTSMDDLGAEMTGDGVSGNNKHVIVIGATNRPDSIDPALRRAGRFDREITLGIPDEPARARILQTLTKTMNISEELSWQQLARATPGFVGADLRALTREAGTVAIKRIFGSLGKHRSLLQLERPADGEAAVQEEEHGGNAAAESPASDGAAPAAAAAHGDSSAKPSGAAAMPGLEWNSSMANTVTEEELAALQITMADFESALPNVQPSAKREGFATIPNVSFKDIGALHGVRSELHLAIVEPIRKPERFAAFGLSPCAGVLLYGPPGCGKTLLAKAIAHESKANFISIKGPELLNKYVGESERAVRQVFSRARASAPCIIFFDELDALCPRRSGEATTSSERVVNQLLTEMDGLEPRLSVFIIAATNRPDLIDPAMLRPGRLDKLLYVPLPEKTERAEILKTITAQMPLADGVDLQKVAHDPRCDGFSGADLAGLGREAALNGLREAYSSSSGYDGGDGAEATPAESAMQVQQRHFDQAFSTCFPSVGKRDSRLYASLQHKLGRSRSRLQAAPVDEEQDGGSGQQQQAGKPSEAVEPTPAS